GLTADRAEDDHGVAAAVESRLEVDDDRRGGRGPVDPGRLGRSVDVDDRGAVSALAGHRGRDLRHDVLVRPGIRPDRAHVDRPAELDLPDVPLETERRREDAPLATPLDDAA